ncbi:glycoside hydrolase TIM-barrel-like domain-containing protein [Paracoccus sp. 1_MG-2023]|uniref:baseplate megatron protein TIM-barrel domain-containing protein n=1 Tax=unclassified Paracoccus (in: a-proteobacteria) TaxID=2688777 RepID=UPI0034C5DDCA
MILHDARLCAAAAGVDAFLNGSKMRGLTTIRSGTGTYPAVSAFAADVRAIPGVQTEIDHAVDWSEYFGRRPGDGSSNVFFPPRSALVRYTFASLRGSSGR